ncbi:hypothetical protein D3C85_349070 [compost metagenome]
MRDYRDLWASSRKEKSIYWREIPAITICLKIRIILFLYKYFVIFGGDITEVFSQTDVSGNFAEPTVRQKLLQQLSNIKLIDFANRNGIILNQYNISFNAFNVFWSNCKRFMNL